MEDARLRRLNALMNTKGAQSSPGTSVLKKREKIRAEVLHSAEPRPNIEDGRDERVELRKQMKELALERHRQEETTTDVANTSNDPNPIVEEKVVDGDGDEDEDEDEEEERAIEPLLRPVFVSRPKRREEIPTVVDDENKEREREAHRLLVEYVRREYEASAKEKDDSGSLNFDPMTIDDTDGINEEEEYEAWKLRELLRIRRDRMERERWEREKMEMERIRNMTEEEKRKMDEEKMKEWMEQPQSQMKFMQKYYHKGAFFMDADDKLYKRDYLQPTGEDANANREMLPEVKQVRDFGKKGRTKWTHLVAEDTTAFDYGWGQKKNEMNYKLISKMGGMRGYSDNPSEAKRTKK